VFGAVDYANSLGFRPHADFKRAARHLGQWDETSAITFGDNGKVVYMYIPNWDGPLDGFLDAVCAPVRRR
jgi:hypothetical protein